MEDYIFFGKVFKWPPSEIDALGWSDRKQIRQAYEDFLNNQAK